MIGLMPNSILCVAQIGLVGYISNIQSVERLVDLTICSILTGGGVVLAEHLQNPYST